MPAEPEWRDGGTYTGNVTPGHDATMHEHLTSLLNLIGAQRDGSLARRAAFVGWMSAPVYLMFAFWALGGWFIAGHDTSLDGHVLSYATLYGFAMTFLWVGIALYGLEIDHARGPDARYAAGVLWAYAITSSFTCYLVGTLSVISGLVMMGAPLVGMMLFPMRQLLVVFGSAIAGVLAASVASALGYLPYAPVLAAGLVENTSPGLYYALSGIVGAGLYAAYETMIMMALVSSWHSREASVRELSITDTLTGVANRRHIIDELERQLVIGARNSAPVAVIMIDIDHFKQVNDRHGHVAGDRALVLAAITLRRCLRTTDLIGRYGGEEFLVLLPGATLAEAREVAERCREAMAQAVVETDKARIRLTASLGVASRPAAQVRDADQLIHLADEAMYLAKQSGRNQVVVA